jgi:DNA-binding SARP family transcriptional activator
LAADVFQGHPYGLLVVDRDKRVVAYNAAVRRMLGEGASILREATHDQACRLVGCGSLDGPLAGSCLIDTALAATEALPEIRIDLPPGARVSAAWITAARMAGRQDHVVVELRPGHAGDRRRRTDLSWGAEPRVRIVALGLTHLEGPADLGGPWLRQRPGELLKYLVSNRGRPVSADEIADQLWPEYGVRALRSVRYYVHTLRKRLEPTATSPARSSYILFESGRYRLSSAIEVDVDEFEELIRQGLDAVEAEDTQAAIGHLSRAVAMYGGDFLADEPYAEWAMAERDRVRSLAATGLGVLAGLRRRSEDVEGALGDLERLAELEPYDLHVHRQLITLTLMSGRRSAALRRYEALRRRMLSTFGEELDFSLTDLRIAG